MSEQMKGRCEACGQWGPLFTVLAMSTSPLRLPYLCKACAESGTIERAKRRKGE